MCTWVVRQGQPSWLHFSDCLYLNLAGGEPEGWWRLELWWVWTQHWGRDIRCVGYPLGGGGPVYIHIPNSDGKQIFCSSGWQIRTWEIAHAFTLSGLSSSDVGIDCYILLSWSVAPFLLSFQPVFMYGLFWTYFANLYSLKISFPCSSFSCPSVDPHLYSLWTLGQRPARPLSVVPLLGCVVLGGKSWDRCPFTHIPHFLFR